MTLGLGAFIGFLVGYLKLNFDRNLGYVVGDPRADTRPIQVVKTWISPTKKATWLKVLVEGTALGIPVPILIFLLGSPHLLGSGYEDAVRLQSVCCGW